MGELLNVVGMPDVQLVSTVPTPASTPEPDSTELLSEPLIFSSVFLQLFLPMKTIRDLLYQVSCGHTGYQTNPTHTTVATPSPPPANQSPDSASLQNHPWGGPELPLEEEEPHSERQKQPSASVVTSVAQESDEEESVIHSFPPLPSKPKTSSPPLPPVSQEPPPSAPLESFSSSHYTEESYSSSIVRQSRRHRCQPDTHLRESCGSLKARWRQSEVHDRSNTHSHSQTDPIPHWLQKQLPSKDKMDEEGVLLSNVMTSLNSSLHGVQDMVIY
ncbi:protein TALPID3-like [Carassius auratus]|uniref:Protein TALPID3-like n=1 Tax=Carassius auratus TaxID=7957 RepID=A0A6P6MZG8_CARAU|nr:protein TALPID3-like [Carassius auratus]